MKDWILAPDATTPPQVHLQVDWVREYSLANAPAPTTKPATTKPSSTKKPSHD